MENYILLFWVSMIVGATIYHNKKSFKIIFPIYCLIGFSIFSFYIAKDMKVYETEMQKIKNLEEGIVK